MRNTRPALTQTGLWGIILRKIKAASADKHGGRNDRRNTVDSGGLRRT